MSAAMATVLPHWLGATSAEAAAALDPDRAAWLSRACGGWAAASYPEWYDQPAPELSLAPG
jgi:hypothetical protein